MMFVEPPITCETIIMLFGIVSRVPRANGESSIRLAVQAQCLIQLSGGETLLGGAGGAGCPVPRHYFLLVTRLLVFRFAPYHEDKSAYRRKTLAS
jgi:hypothetical protein